jgi:hypothetical protein
MEYAKLIGCPDDDNMASCLRGKSRKDLMEPYISWFCPEPHDPTDPWCNRTMTGPAGADADLKKRAAALGLVPSLGGNGTWPAWRPPMAPIAGWTAVVDGYTLPATPYALIQVPCTAPGPPRPGISLVFFLMLCSDLLIL